MVLWETYPTSPWAQLARATQCKSGNPQRNILLAGTVHSRGKFTGPESKCISFYIQHKLQRKTHLWLTASSVGFYVALLCSMHWFDSMVQNYTHTHIHTNKQSDIVKSCQSDTHRQCSSLLHCTLCTWVSGLSPGCSDGEMDLPGKSCSKIRLLIPPKGKAGLPFITSLTVPTYGQQDTSLSCSLSSKTQKLTAILWASSQPYIKIR